MGQIIDDIFILDENELFRGILLIRNQFVKGRKGRIK